MSKRKTTKEYFEEWHPYDLLIQHNYMRHQEIIACIRQKWLQANFEKSSILEIGCGNAYAVVEALSDQTGLSYTGIDLSAYALSSAADTLKKTDWSVQLIEGDAKQHLKDLGQTFDCIVAGFSLHHFSELENRQTLGEIHRLLKPNGLTFIYDIVTREGETREHFLERLISGVDVEKVGFKEAQMETMSQHIRSFDFPVSLSDWEEWARTAGFNEMSWEYRDPEEFYGFLLLK